MEWISVEDRLPDFGQRTLVVNRTNSYVTVAFRERSDQDCVDCCSENNKWNWVFKNENFTLPTHWMFLPKGPR